MNRQMPVIVLVVLFSLAFAAAGCSPSRDIGAGGAASQTPTPARPPDVQHATLRGVAVTVEVTTGPGPGLVSGFVSAQPTVSPAAGLVRVSVHATAVNSTEATVAMNLKHNFPRVLDARGNYYEAGPGTALRARGMAGGFRFPEGLAPGGTLETVQYFDLRPGQTGLRFVWILGDAGEAHFNLP